MDEDAGKMTEEDVEFYKRRIEEQGGFKRFIWNPDTSEFCGRSGMSWLKITTFYIILYFFLAGFWLLMLFVFHQTVDVHEPKWTLDESLIGSSPGLGFRPHPMYANNEDTSLISFTPGDAKEWATSLDQFLEEWAAHMLPSSEQITAYHPGRQNSEFTDYCDFEETSSDNRVCRIILEDLGNVCTMENNFGFDNGRPCVLIKLNRIFDWKPEPYPNNDSFPSSMPEHVRNNYDPNYVYISCEGETAADKENMGSIEYYPEYGRIPTYFFPFTNLDGYLSPFVFVHFENLKRAILINIECKAWANNIFHDRQHRLGSVHFELMVN